MLNIVGKFLGLGQGGKDEESRASTAAEVSAERKEYRGKVTSLHGSYGLVDGEVYFNFDDVADGFMPKVGATVIVTARRKHGMGGWRAEKVTVQHNTEDWDEPTDQTAELNIPDHIAEEPEQKQDDFIVGKITGIRGDQGIINDSIQFYLADIVDYIPNKEDWVTAKVVYDDTASEAPVATQIKPLREKEYEGTINAVNQGFGYIDQDIYFTFNACVENYLPRRGDTVCGKAIESVRGRSTWRATSVDILRGKKTNLDNLNSDQGNLNRTRMKSVMELLEDKNGIEIVKTIDFGRIELGSSKEIQIGVRNTGTKAQCIQKCTVHSSGKNSQFEVKDINSRKDCSNENPSDVFHLDPGKYISVALYCHARYLGADKVLVVIEFDGFKIGRHALVSVFEPSQYRLDPSNPYQRKKSYGKYREGQQYRDNWVVPGQKPERVRPNLKLPNRLGQYVVPDDLRDCVLDQRDIVTVSPHLGEELCMEYYSERFSALLHLEEIQEEIEIREFDMERVCMRTFGEFLALKVPGLAEGRPSVLIGDRVILSDPGLKEHGPSYEGYVHEVMSEEVLLKFHSDFHSSYTGEDYDVQFTFNRTTLRRAHQAVHFATKLGSQVIFPDTLHPRMPQTRVMKGVKPPPRAVVARAQNVVGIRRCPLGTKQVDHLSEHTFFNTKLNPRQRSAVLRMLNGQSRPMPYILFGPPGTGKTVTLVEAILQIFQHMPSSRIIACTPSNSAADLLVERLHASGLLQKSDMVRLNAFQRSVENISKSIQPYCLDGEDLELVSRFRVLVCTCSSSGMMYSLALRPGHFTHVFVDESGQSMEPECLIPVGLAASGGGQVVLAGDPKQLGPVLRSSQAKTYGLDLSFLERLMDLALYQRDENKFADHGCYDPLLVTKLVENYRSHPALVNLSSRLFYDGELEVSADKSMINCLSQWDQLPTPGFPMIFHGVRGDDMREGNSPSWFNPQEVFQVNSYLKLLIENTLHPLEYDDIGVITPYRKQVEKIRFMIDKFGMEKVKVGSVEEFQGQERLVMIISTVRSNEELTGSDIRHNLGFLSNPKRFNVSITRAQALMVIIGNPFILSQDANWRALLRYAVENQAYMGCEPPDLYDSHPVIPPEESPTPADTQNSTEEDLHSSQISEDSYQLVRHDLSVVAELSEDSLTDKSATDTAKSAPTSQVFSPAVNRSEKANDHSAEHIDTAAKLKALPEMKPKAITSNNAAIQNSDSEKINTVQRGRSDTGGTSDGWTTEEEASLSASYYSDDLELSEDLNTTANINDIKQDDNIPKSQTVCIQSVDIPQAERVVLSKPQELDTDTVTKAVANVMICSNSDTMDESNHLYPLDNLVIHQNSEDENDNRPVTCNLGTLELPRTLSNTCHVTDSESSAPGSLEKVSHNNSTAEGEDSSSWCDDEEGDSNVFVEEKEEEEKEGVKETEYSDKTGDSDQCSGEDDVNNDDSQGYHGDDDREEEGEEAEEEDAEEEKEEGEEGEEEEGEEEGEVCEGDESYITTSSSCTDTESEADGESSPPGETESTPPQRGWYNGSEWNIQPTDAMLAMLTKSRENYEVYKQCRQNQKRQNPKVGNAKSSPQNQGHQKYRNFAPHQRNKENQEPSSRLGADQLPSSSPTNPFPKTPETSQPSSQQKPQHLSPAQDSRHANRPNQLETKIIRQLEYYFGDLNLIKDQFLQVQISANPEGWVPLKVLITFNRLKSLSMDFNVIVTAVNKSSSGLVQVHTDGQSVRRNPDFPQITDHDVWKRQLASRSIALSGVPFRERLDVIQSSCEHYGEVEHVEKDIWWNENPLGSNSNRNITLVVFYDEESVAKASKYVTVFRRRWKISTLSSFVQECVDYFYDKKVKSLGREQLVPVGQRSVVPSPTMIEGPQTELNVSADRSRDNVSFSEHVVNGLMESQTTPETNPITTKGMQRGTCIRSEQGTDFDTRLRVAEGQVDLGGVDDNEWTTVPKAHRISPLSAPQASQCVPPQPVERDRQYKQNLWMAAQQKPHTLKLRMNPPAEITPGQISQNSPGLKTLGRGAVILSHLQRASQSPGQGQVAAPAGSYSDTGQCVNMNEESRDESSMYHNSMSTPSYSSFIHTDSGSLGVSTLSSSVLSPVSGQDQPTQYPNPSEGPHLEEEGGQSHNPEGRLYHESGVDYSPQEYTPGEALHHHSKDVSMNTSQQSDNHVDVSFQGVEGQSFPSHSTPTRPRDDGNPGSPHDGSGQEDSYRMFMSLEQFDDDVIVESSEEEVIE